LGKAQGASQFVAGISEGTNVEVATVQASLRRVLRKEKGEPLILKGKTAVLATLSAGHDLEF
jgi:hypothetical protein